MKYQVEEANPSLEKENAADPAQMMCINAVQTDTSGPRQSVAQSQALEDLKEMKPDEDLADLLLIYELTGFRKIDAPKGIEFFETHQPEPTSFASQTIPQTQYEAVPSPPASP